MSGCGKMTTAYGLTKKILHCSYSDGVEKFMVIQQYKEATGYYVAAFDTWGRNLRSGLSTRVREWCVKTYGPVNRNDSTPRWCDDTTWGEVRFRDESDLCMFLLKWE